MEGERGTWVRIALLMGLSSLLTWVICWWYMVAMLEGAVPIHPLPEQIDKMAVNRDGDTNKYVEKVIHATMASLVTPLVSTDGVESDMHVLPENSVLSTTAAPTPLRRHPTYRIAFLLPWLGSSFPIWFNYFLRSLWKSEYLADFLIFHEGAPLPPEQFLNDNIFFYDLGVDGMARLYSRKLVNGAKRVNKNINSSEVETMLIDIFKSSPYLVTEFKPANGVIFEDYLSDYTHWTYADPDMIVGDLPSWVELPELRDYDVVTYTFGDNQRLYMRGQYTAHVNTKSINTMYQYCSHLGKDLEKNLKRKLKDPNLFFSAEGCYSKVISQVPKLRVKFATKFFSDFSKEKGVILNDGILRRCRSHGVVHENCDPLADTTADRLRHSPDLPGLQVPDGPRIEAQLGDSDCMKWVPEAYRVCLAFPNMDEKGMYNVYLEAGKYYIQRYKNLDPPHSFEGPFFHFQIWKETYKQNKKSKMWGENFPISNTFNIASQGLYPIGFNKDW
eukprot:Rmarinus@m.25999